MSQIVQFTAQEILQIFMLGQLWIVICAVLGALTHLFVIWTAKKIKSKKEQQINNV